MLAGPGLKPVIQRLTLTRPWMAALPEWYAYVGLSPEPTFAKSGRKDGPTSWKLLCSSGVFV